MTKVTKKRQYQMIVPHIQTIFCFVILNLWNEREKHINTDYAVTGWMSCLITYIREYVFKNAKNSHHIQVNTVINSLFSG